MFNNVRKSSKIVILFCMTLCRVSASITMQTTHTTRIDQARLCPNNDEMDCPLRNFKFFSVNRTHKALNYDVTYPYPIDHNVGSTMTIQKFTSDGGWKTIPFLPFQPDMCANMLKYFPDVWINEKTAMGVREPDKCPIPAGNYSMRNYIMDLSSLENVPFWSGRFKLTTIAKRTDNNRNVYCLEVIATLSDKL